MILSVQTISDFVNDLAPTLFTQNILTDENISKTAGKFFGNRARAIMKHINVNKQIEKW